MCVPAGSEASTGWREAILLVGLMGPRSLAGGGVLGAPRLRLVSQQLGARGPTFQDLSLPQPLAPLFLPPPFCSSLPPPSGYGVPLPPIPPFHSLLPFPLAPPPAPGEQVKRITVTDRGRPIHWLNEVGAGGTCAGGGAQGAGVWFVFKY